MHTAETEPPCHCESWASTRGALGGLRLPFEHESAASARRFVTCVAAAWGVPHISETAELLTSETFTNALLHGKPLNGSALCLITLRWHGMFRVEVHDAGGAGPRLCDPGETDESGRGWFLVDKLADDHGVYQTDFGKGVWFACAAWPEQ